MRLPRSLQGRLLVLVLGVVGVVWAGAAVATWVDVRHELDELLDAHLAQSAALLVAQQSRHIGEDDDDALADAPSLHRYAPQVAFQVWHERRLALRSSNAPLQPMSRQRRGFETLQFDGVAWRVFAARGAESDVQVYVGERVASRSGILWVVVRSVLWPLAVALPLLALTGWWAVRQGLAPMRRLGAASARREAQTLAPIAAASDTPAEMQPLVAALNGLFARIAELLESERRFTADAAHELRTPIAAIRAQAQVALASAGDEGERRHALEATLIGCDRAAHLVDQLLTLSRLESAAPAPKAGLDVTSLARRVVAELAPLALAKQQSIELDADQPCSARGDEALLGALLRNLVDNAIRYSPPSARVRIAVVRGAEGGVELTVEDSGPGMTEEQRVRLGERFYRVLGSGQPGSGLGWSIVRRIAAAHGATVEVGRSAALGGLRVRVALD